MIYDYVCRLGHVTTKRGGLSDVSASCASCRRKAMRKEFNHVAIVGETVPREQRREFADFQEAQHEVDYAYTKAENKGMPVKRPDYWKEAKKKAAAKGVKMRQT